MDTLRAKKQSFFLPPAAEYRLKSGFKVQCIYMQHVHIECISASVVFFDRCSSSFCVLAAMMSAKPRVPLSPKDMYVQVSVSKYGGLKLKLRPKLTRNTVVFYAPQKPQSSAPRLLSTIFSFLDLHGRSAKAWKIVRATPLGPQSPACCAPPNARLLTGIEPAESPRCSAADSHAAAGLHAHAEATCGCK